MQARKMNTEIEQFKEPNDQNMNLKHIFIVVTVCALAGMILGGSFGFAAGKITPEFFRHIVPWQDVEPVGIATFFGATSGVLLGGGLGCFGIVIQLNVSLIHYRSILKGLNLSAQRLARVRRGPTLGNNPKNHQR
jgi:hypothetical protein